MGGFCCNCYQSDPEDSENIKNICKIHIRSCRKVSLKLENEAFLSICSDIKPVKTGSRLFAELHLGILLLGWS